MKPSGVPSPIVSSHPVCQCVHGWRRTVGGGRLRPSGSYARGGARRAWLPLWPLALSQSVASRRAPPAAASFICAAVPVSGVCGRAESSRGRTLLIDGPLSSLRGHWGRAAVTLARAHTHTYTQVREGMVRRREMAETRNGSLCISV